MRLLVVHKVLISGAIVLAILLAVRGGVLYAQNRQTGDLVIGLGSLVLAGGFARYLRSIWRR